MSEFDDHADAFRWRLRRAIEADPQVLLEQHGATIPDADVWFMDILGPGDVVLRELTTTTRPLNVHYIPFAADRADLTAWMADPSSLKPNGMHTIEKLTTRVQSGYSTLRVAPEACMPPSNVKLRADHTFIVALVRYRPDI